MLWLIASPSPTPLLLFRGEERLENAGQKFIGYAASRRRESVMRWSSLSALKLVLIQTLPPCGMASKAFIINASITCSICVGIALHRRQVRDLDVDLDLSLNFELCFTSRTQRRPPR